MRKRLWPDASSWVFTVCEEAGKGFEQASGLSELHLGTLKNYGGIRADLGTAGGYQEIAQ